MLWEEFYDKMGNPDRFFISSKKAYIMVPINPCLAE